MSPHRGTELASLRLREDADVFTARQLARDLAATAGLDRLDATRMATAISELARETVAAGGGGLTFMVRSGALVSRVTTRGLTDDHPSIRSARRLVDELSLTPSGDRIDVVLTKSVPTTIAPAVLEQLRSLAAAQAPASPLDELRHQHEELVTALDAVQAKNAELEALNDELEETNRGVMALYNELSGELERTNQGVVALYAEIDDKNAQLLAASEAKSRFLRSISHELRTPVNSVLGLARLLTDPGAGPLTGEQAEQVEFIRSSALDLGSLVDALLDLARAESGRLDPKPVDVPVGALLEDLRSMTIPLLRDGVTLVVAPVPADLTVTTDPDLVRHVLRNLLSNAAKFTTSGTVGLTVTPGADGTVVEVADTGVGMAEEVQERVFEEFFQAKTPLHAETKGTGLGLPFALRVAEALGGTIAVASSADSGSTFTLTLPGRPPVRQQHMR